jgi:hypothetical protein
MAQTRYPENADAIARSGMQLAKIEVRRRPHVLLVDDDIGVKKIFFRRFANGGAGLLYAADALRGYWKARRVADHCMRT